LSFDGNVSRDTSPPFETLEELRHAFAIIEEVGPCYDTGKLLQKLEDNLFDGSRLKSVADSHPLKFITGVAQTTNKILEKIPVDRHNALEMVTGLRALNATRADLSCTRNSTVRLSEENQIEQELVFLRTDTTMKIASGRPTLYSYAQISRDWARFFVELDAIIAATKELTLRCLQEGRAICIGQEPPRFALQFPTDWETTSALRRHSKSQFLLTCDLPEAWYFKKMGNLEKTDRTKKAEAIRWLYAQYLLSERPQEFGTKAAALKVLSTKFRMKTDKVRREVWDEAPISNWRKPGRPKNS
jgi:hypothetical protein